MAKVDGLAVLTLIDLEVRPEVDRLRDFLLGHVEHQMAKDLLVQLSEMEKDIENCELLGWALVEHRYGVAHA